MQLLHHNLLVQLHQNPVDEQPLKIKENIERIRHLVEKITESAHREKDCVRILPVSKTHDHHIIRQAYGLGLQEFGENYADELATKAEQLRDLRGIHWVFIGQLQSNKIQKIVANADEIQSIATEKHARYIERYAAQFGKKDYPVWIVVNAGDENSKQGARFEELTSLCDYITHHCPTLKLQGLMAIPPAIYSDRNISPISAANIPPIYKKLRSQASLIGAGKLSLGMSGDLALAITAGSDCVRIGTAIFGARPA